MIFSLSLSEREKERKKELLNLFQMSTFVIFILVFFVLFVYGSNLEIQVMVPNIYNRNVVIFSSFFIHSFLLSHLHKHGKAVYIQKKKKKKKYKKEAQDRSFKLLRSKCSSSFHFLFLFLILFFSIISLYTMIIEYVCRKFVERGRRSVQ